LCASTTSLFKLKTLSRRTDTSQALSPSQYFLPCLRMKRRKSSECWWAENASSRADRLATLSADASEAPEAPRHSANSTALV